jgi:hypothetical protein
MSEHATIATVGLVQSAAICGIFAAFWRWHSEVKR